jgi:hypothetical protein
MNTFETVLKELNSKIYTFVSDAGPVFEDNRWRYTRIVNGEYVTSIPSDADLAKLCFQLLELLKVEREEYPFNSHWEVDSGRIRAEIFSQSDPGNPSIPPRFYGRFSLVATTYETPTEE